MLKKVVLGLGLSVVSLSAFADMDAAKKAHLAQLQVVLENSWKLHTHADERMMQKFTHIVESLAASSPAIEAKLKEYMTKFGVQTKKALIEKIFLLRSNAHMDSFYRAIDLFEDLTDETKEVVTKHVGPTYKVVVENSFEQNIALLKLLESRQENQASVLKTLPAPFKEVTNLLSGEELRDYLETLYYAHFNSLRVMALLGEVHPPEATKKDL